MGSLIAKQNRHKLIINQFYNKISQVQSFLTNTNNNRISLLQIMYNQQFVNCLLLAAELNSSHIIQAVKLNLSEQAAPTSQNGTQTCSWIQEDKKYIVSFKNYQIQEFSQIGSAWFEGVHICALLFDFTSQTSFHSITKIIEKLRKNQLSLPPIRYILIGIRSNSKPKQISYHQGQSAVKDIGTYLQIEELMNFNFQPVCKQLQDANPYYYSQYYLTHLHEITPAAPSKLKKIHHSTSMATKIIKSAILGSLETGKTVFSLQLSGDYTSNTNEYIPTIGIDFKVQYVSWEQKQYKIHLFQTSGNPKFQQIAKTYFRTADLVFIFYDPTNKESFQQVTHYHQQVMNCSYKTYKQFVLVATKSDLKDQHVISQAQGQIMAKKLGMLFLSICNMNKTQVQDCFTKAMEYYLLCSPKQAGL